MRRLVRPTARRRGRPSDAGAIGLAELAVGMAVTAVLTTLITALVISTFRQTRDGMSRVPMEGMAQQAVDTMARATRAAITPAGENQSIQLATPTAITFYALLNRPDALVVSGMTVPSKVELYASGACIWRAVTPARPAPTGGQTYVWDTGRSTLCLVRTAVLPSAVFSYFTSSSTIVALPVTAAGLSSADRDLVRSVQINLTVKEPRTGVLSNPVDTRVTLVNRLAEDSG